MQDVQAYISINEYGAFAVFPDQPRVSIDLETDNVLVMNSFFQT